MKRIELYEKTSKKISKIFAEENISISEKGIQKVLQSIMLMVENGLGKKKNESSGGSEVWEAYRDMFARRYKYEPVRNAKVNTLAKNLVDSYGLEHAVVLAKYYIYQSDQVYLINYHPFERLVMDAHKLFIRCKTGKKVTREQANKKEQMSDNLNIAEQYLNKTGGENGDN